jgi:arginine/ornithine N-succinyltransferase beta subunit
MAAIVRPATRSDLDRLEAMIAHVDLGMLTVSTREGHGDASRNRCWRLRGRPRRGRRCHVMEEEGQLIGVTCCQSRVRRPFYSYRISRDSKLAS